MSRVKLPTHYLIALAVVCHSGWVRADDSNRNEVRANLEKDGWRMIWGKNFTEADWARGVAAIAASVASENPGPFLAWFEQTLEENFDKIKSNLKDVTRDDLKRWVLESLKEKRVITHKGLRIHAGFATYDRWQRVVYDEPRTRIEIRRDEIFGIETKVPVVFTERVERRSNLPNWHQFYIRYKLIKDNPGDQAGDKAIGDGDTRTTFVTRGSRFERAGGNGWIERRDDGTSASFVEKARTDQYVEIYDERRNMLVRLYRDRGEFLHRDTGRWMRWNGSEGDWIGAGGPSRPMHNSEDRPRPRSDDEDRLRPRPDDARPQGPTQKQRVDAAASRIERLAGNYAQFMEDQQHLPEARQVLTEARLLSNAASRVQEARSRSQAIEYINQVDRCWDDLRSRLERLGAAGGTQARKMQPIGNLVDEMRDAF